MIINFKKKSLKNILFMKNFNNKNIINISYEIFYNYSKIFLTF